MTDYGTKYDRLYVAIVTPYKDGSYDPDEEQLRSFLRFFLQPEYVEAGIGIIINPEAGETCLLFVIPPVIPTSGGEKVCPLK